MNFSQRIGWCLAKLVIKTGWIKEVRYNADDLMPLLAATLPHHESFKVPGGTAKLTVLAVQIKLGKNNDEGVDLQLLCSLEIISMQKNLYRAHFSARIKTVPFYHKESTSIRVSKGELTSLILIQDEYLMMNLPKDMFTTIAPSMVKNLINATLGTAISVIEGFTPPIKKYLKLFTHMNQQKVLDFHHSQIQQLLSEVVESPRLCYKLQPSDFEEQLFALFGQQLSIEDHHIVFKFT